MNTIKKFLCLAFAAVLLAGCSESPYDGRMVKKFLSRLNAREFSCASQYIFPGDHPKLKLFTDVMDKNPDTFFKLISKENTDVNGQKAVKVKLQCVNPTPYFRNYMEALKVMDKNGIIEDTWLIRETADGICLSFNWANIKGENLILGRLGGSGTIPVYRSRSKNSTQLNNFYSGEKVIIDDYPADSPWVRCFKVDVNCNVINGYVERTELATSDGRFFKLSIFDTFGLLVAVILLVVFGSVFLFIGAIVDAIKEGTGAMGWILIPALIFGLLFVVYQLLEKILFELFIINLPY